METLLIDDDKAFSQVLARSLASRGMSIALAHSADEALAISPTYSRVILDLNLGQDNGLVLLPQLKACNSDCTIVVLTG